MKRKILGLLLILALVTGWLFAVPALAAETATVTITATPEYLAITNSENTWAIGPVVASHEYYWWTVLGTAPAPEPFEADDMKSTITNTGSVTSDVDVKIAAFAGGVGWAISADETPAADEVSVRAGITGTADRASMIQVLVGDTELVDSILAAGTMKWCMSLETGTFTDGDAKSGVVTLTITKHV